MGDTATPSAAAHTSPLSMFVRRRNRNEPSAVISKTASTTPLLSVQRRWSSSKVNEKRGWAAGREGCRTKPITAASQRRCVLEGTSSLSAQLPDRYGYFVTRGIGRPDPNRQRNRNPRRRARRDPGIH